MLEVCDQYALKYNRCRAYNAQRIKIYGDVVKRPRSVLANGLITTLSSIGNQPMDFVSSYLQRGTYILANKLRADSNIRDS